MKSTVVSFLVFGLIIPSSAHPAMGEVVPDGVGEEEKTPTWVSLTAATLTTVDVVTIFENVTALTTREPRKVTATAGIIAGVGSIAFGGYVISAEQNETLGIVLGLVGGVSLGLGAFGARVTERADGSGVQHVRVGPILVRDGDKGAWGIALSGRF